MRINVEDENKGSKKQFTCAKSKLLRHMRYFEKYKAHAGKLSELDISVHCDLDVFEWLMRYVEHDGHFIV